jgi:hypothetical protein
MYKIIVAIVLCFSYLQAETLPRLKEKLPALYNKEKLGILYAPERNKECSDTMPPKKNPNNDEADFLIDMDRTPNYTGDISGVRFTNAYSLEDTVEVMLRYRKAHPDKVLWAMFDMNDTLITYGLNKASLTVHPNINGMFDLLRSHGISVHIVSNRDVYKALDPLKILIDPLYVVNNTTKDFGHKGNALLWHMNRHDQKPDHIFFVDDKLHEPYLLSVEKTLKKEKIPFTTFHQFGYTYQKILNHVRQNNYHWANALISLKTEEKPVPIRLPQGYTGEKFATKLKMFDGK